MIEGRDVKFLECGIWKHGRMHKWFLCTGNIQVPYALIEKDDGTMILINYHDVIFEKMFYDFEDLMEKGEVE